MTDGMQLLDVANDFASRNENRKRNFGTFVEKDLCCVKGISITSTDELQAAQPSLH